MDTARKTIRDRQRCHFCMNYKPKFKNGKKLSRGNCIITGSYKQRTDKCKKYFRGGVQVGLFDL